MMILTFIWKKIDEKNEQMILSYKNVKKKRKYENICLQLLKKKQCSTS